MEARGMLEILLIEDDQVLSEFIIDYLDMEAMSCDYASTGASGIDLALSRDGEYDCIVLDLNLPVVDGLTVCETLRARGISTPIIMLTARDTLEDKLAGFSNGADDYLCKPFEIQELAARINSLSLRNMRNSLLMCEDLIMYTSKRSVIRGSRKILLSHIEWKILRLLLSCSPQPVSRQKIISGIWGDTPPETDSLKVHIHNLRKAIDTKGEKQLIHTIPGYGYAICPEI